MIENEQKLNSSNQQKEKIRERYKGINPDELDVIPALPQQRLDDENRTQRVAVYARVSTDDPRQTSSYELQKNHYQDVVSRHPNWVLIDIYADEGISGTSLQHRDSFLRMIEDCKAGKIDLIITKSVSRFARNVIDCIGHVRQLAAMHPPIGVFFETENIYTLNSNSEMSLSFISTLAQEESHTKSEIMNSSIEMRFKRGIFLTPPLLGYDQDENGNLIVNEEEAKTVRLIFFMYLYGYSTQEIADQLTTLKRRTKKGNTTWSPGTILSVLQNERHCGDVLARKTFTPNYLDHKSKRNKQDRNQYRKKDHHEPIVSRDDFIAVQKLIGNAKYGNKGLLPELTVISNGILRGFVLINPRWAGFKAADYREASKSIYGDSENISNQTVAVNSGDFDLREFEIARGQFFETSNKIAIRISNSALFFSTECVRKFSTNYVELLIHPQKQILAIRPSKKESRNSLQWSKIRDELYFPRQTAGSAFLPNIYDLLGWDQDLKYRITGIRKQQDCDTVLLFNLKENEILISGSSLSSEDDEDITPSFDENVTPLGSKSKLVAYPSEWGNSFGNNYYANDTSIPSVDTGQDWDTQTQGIVYPTEESSLAVTSPEEIKNEIRSITESMKEASDE